MEDLTAAEKRLLAARKERENGLAEVSKDPPALLERLDSIADERAASCRQALVGRKPDVERALAIATGSPGGQPGSEIGRLRQLSQLSAPAGEKVRDAVAALRDAAEVLDRTAGSEAGRALALAGLLASALDHYHAHGAGPCPVCGRAGALDKTWQDQIEREIARLQAHAAAAREARARLRAEGCRASGVVIDAPDLPFRCGTCS